MHGFAYILCKCTLSHWLPHLPPTHPHTHTHTLDMSESFLQGGCVQYSCPNCRHDLGHGQGLCHDSQQAPTGSSRSTIGPVPWVQWREMTLHTLTGTTEQCYSRTTAMSHAFMCTLPYRDLTLSLAICCRNYNNGNESLWWIRWSCMWAPPWQTNCSLGNGLISQVG